MSLTGRSLVSISDFTGQELDEVLAAAAAIKADPGAFGPAPFKDKTLGMIFLKPSLRTRVSFETGMTKMGGHAIYLSPNDISLGKRETTEDIAMVLSRYVDFIMARVFGHDVVVDLAKHATVPVINGLSDMAHPCQCLADLQTIIERRGKLAGLHLCFIGDGNNVAHSLMLGGALTGMSVTVVCPEGYGPDPDVLATSRELGAGTGATIDYSHDLEAIRGADALYTDVWASMGQEAEAAARKEIFKPYRIGPETVALAPEAVILHCLPAHYDEEIAYESSRLPTSAIFDQAENRMWAQLGLMLMLAGAERV